jgi:hypothetical protein
MPFGLVHQERPCEGKVERAVQRRRVKLVNVAGEQVHVLQPKRRNNRLCALNGRLAEVNADQPPSRPHHFRQQSQRTDRAAPAVNHRPPGADAHPAERTPGMLREGLRKAQQPPQVFVATVKDVASDLVCGRIRHARLLRRVHAF